MNEQIIMGNVVDCETGRPLEGVRLLLEPGGKKASMESKSGVDGRYRFELHNTSSISLSAHVSGYSDTAVRLTFKHRSASDTFEVPEICLRKPELKRKTGPDSSIHRVGGFGFRDYALSSECRSRLDSIAVIMMANDKLMVELDGYTDGRGGESYNLILATRRVEACIGYLSQKGIARDRLIGRAMGKCCPLFPEKVNGKDDPAARQRNRRVEYKFISKQ
jgi:outer membrane protein OmpA-like peptidoglycan-associated protein